MNREVETAYHRKYYIQNKFGTIAMICNVEPFFPLIYPNRY